MTQNECGVPESASYSDCVAGLPKIAAVERHPFRTQESHLWLLQLRPDPVHGHPAAEEVASHRWNAQYRLPRREVKSARQSVFEILNVAIPACRAFHLRHLYPPMHCDFRSGQRKRDYIAPEAPFPVETGIDRPGVGIVFFSVTVSKPFRVSALMASSLIVAGIGMER